MEPLADHDFAARGLLRAEFAGDGPTSDKFAVDQYRECGYIATMGSYSSFSVGRYNLFSAKSYIEPTTATVFQESDRFRRLVRLTANDEVEVVAQTVDPQLESTSDGQTDDTFIELGYESTVRIVRERLDVMGYTLQVAGEAFDNGLREQFEANRGWMEVADPELRKGGASDDAVLANLTLQAWTTAFRDLNQRSVTRYSFDSAKEKHTAADLSPLQQYMLSGHSEWYQFPPSDFRSFLRATIECFADEERVALNLADLVDGGYYEEDEPLVDLARQQLISAYPSTAPVVVLTEGSTDGRILSLAMRLLRPHLSDYYSFMDFASFNAPGGATQLVGVVKAFAGAGISNRVIGLFDNDTAGRNAMRGLEKVALPATTVIRTLPPIPLGLNYPTLGPSGLVNMDVNGLAGGLELYFGLDTLTQSDGKLSPVQWKGYDESMRAYQGELVGKLSLQQRFEAKLSDAFDDPTRLKCHDWSGVEAILDCIQFAFA